MKAVGKLSINSLDSLQFPPTSHSVGFLHRYWTRSWSSLAVAHAGIRVSVVYTG